MILKACVDKKKKKQIKMKQESFWYQEMLQISKEKLFYPRILYQEKFYFWNSRTQKKTSPSLFIRVLLKVII